MGREKPPNREGSCRPRCSFATFPRLHLESSASPCRGRTGATEDPQVVRDDAETNPAVHAFDAVVTTARQSMALFEHTDAALAAGPPTQRPLKPARPGLATSTRQGHSVHATRVGRFLVGPRAEAAVSDGQSWSVSEELFMTLEARHPQVAVGTRAAHTV